MYKPLAATALALLVCATPVSAFAVGCPPIFVADAEGDRHEVRMNVVDCAEASAIIRGYFNRTSIDARDVARVLVNMIGRGGSVSVQALGDAQVGTEVRGNGKVVINTDRGKVSVRVNDASAEVSNVGNNKIMITQNR